MLIGDEWNGLYDLLANMIAKYASELGIDDMPDSSHNRECSSDSKIPPKSHICCFRESLIQF